MAEHPTPEQVRRLGEAIIAWTRAQNAYAKALYIDHAPDEEIERFDIERMRLLAELERLRVEMRGGRA